MKPLLVVSACKVQGSQFTKLGDLGYTVVPTLDSEAPAVAQIGGDQRFEAAVACLQGMLASPPIVDRVSVDRSVWANVAVEFADALLERLARDD